jgi:tRNA G46 methylase TrmB
VLKLARQFPDALVVGVDTSADALRAASRPAKKGGVSNTLFVIADAREALESLHGRIDDLRITLPWGSLLRPILEGEEAFALAVAGSV